MTNSFLLVVILFVSIGSINSQHSICKVGDVKIESVIDISSTIKYLVTFDGTYNYWYWNEEDMTNEEGQNLTSKQAFGYDYKHLACASRFQSKSNNIEAFNKVNSTLEERYHWKADFIVESDGTLSGIKQQLAATLPIAGIDGCAFYNNEIYYVKLNKLTLESYKNQIDPLSPILDANLTAIFTYDDALYAVDINGKNIYQLNCTTEISCSIAKENSTRNFFSCHLYKSPFTTEDYDEFKEFWLILLVSGVIILCGAFLFSKQREIISGISKLTRTSRSIRTDTSTKQKSSKTSKQIQKKRSYYFFRGLINTNNKTSKTSKTKPETKKKRKGSCLSHAKGKCDSEL